MPAPTPLAKKLQIKPNHQLLVLHPPQGGGPELSPLPDGAALVATARAPVDAVLLYVSSAADLEAWAAKAIAKVKPGGLLWIAYPKQSSGVKTDLTRDHGWAAVDRAGWGGVSQVALDATWSALRFRPEGEVERKPGSAVAPGTRATMGKRRPDAATAATPIAAPADLTRALAGHAAARSTWQSLAASHVKEYVSWIAEAKKPETRARRIAKAVEMLAAGQRDRNAKYR
jgi:hypothetical protein